MSQSRDWVCSSLAKTSEPPTLITSEPTWTYWRHSSFSIPSPPPSTQKSSAVAKDKLHKIEDVVFNSFFPTDLLQYSSSTQFSTINWWWKSVIFSNKSGDTSHISAYPNDSNSVAVIDKQKLLEFILLKSLIGKIQDWESGRRIVACLWVWTIYLKQDLFCNYKSCRTTREPSTFVLFLVRF